MSRQWWCFRCEKSVAYSHIVEVFDRGACTGECAPFSVLKALSVRAPWWWMILHAGKDVENRDWPTRFRGTVYLHASKWWGKEHISLALSVCAASPELAEKAFDDAAAMRAAGGSIVGAVDIVDCVEDCESPWFCGPVGFVLKNPIVFNEPIACTGRLGFFTPPAEVLAACESAFLSARGRAL